MCAACGVPTHVLLEDVGQPAKFAALRDPACRVYLLGGALSMMADNVEHVITYWVVWQRFHSPALAGFEVISHWLPFLLLSPYFGALADRHDCRKLIQGAQLLFMAVSACWGLLFFTGTLQVWNACVLLILHGMAGAIWMPAEQLMLEDFVGPADLPSAIRLNSTGRSLGILFGPVVGSALLLGLGPERGILCNIAIYLPLTILMARTKYTGHTRGGVIARQRVGALGALRVFREVSKDRVIVAMIVLAGLGSFFVGSAIQTAMPAIATSMGSVTSGGASGGTAYGVLLFANGLGGVLGGLLLEGTGWLRLSVRAAIWSTGVYGVSSALFAFSHNYVVAALLLVVGGVANLAAMSITQTVVQLLAPREKRGQVVGLYGVGANGMRLGSGFTVGFFGAVVGLRVSLGVSALVMVACTAAVAGYLALGNRTRSVRSPWSSGPPRVLGMHLTPREEERLLLAAAADLARRRLARGTRLGATEAVALVCDEICEMAWDGIPLAEVAARARSVVPAAALLPGVPSLVPVLEVEALFPWGSTLVHVDAPFGASDSFPERAGATVTEPGYIELAAGLPRRTVVLSNTGPRDVWISSHFPLDQINPAVVVAGGLAVGCRLDLPAGEALLLRPGETREAPAVIVAFPWGTS